MYSLVFFVLILVPLLVSLLSPLILFVILMPCFVLRIHLFMPLFVYVFAGAGMFFIFLFSM